MQYKYQGCVADKSYYQALRTASNEVFQKHKEESRKYNYKYECGLDLMYSLRRMPRIYWDEINLK